MGKVIVDIQHHKKDYIDQHGKKVSPPQKVGVPRDNPGLAERTTEAEAGTEAAEENPT